MKQRITHRENLPSLKRVEGQVRGIQRMVETEQYCIDIVNQIHAAVKALYGVSEKILLNHINGCVVSAFKSSSKLEKTKKVNELMHVINRLHKQR